MEKKSSKEKFFYCKNCRYPYNDLFSGEIDEDECFIPLNKDTFEMILPCNGGSDCRRLTVLTCKIVKVELENIDTGEREDITHKSDKEIEEEGDRLSEEWFAEQEKKER